MSQNLLQLVEINPLDMNEWLEIKPNVYSLKADTQQIMYLKDGLYYVQLASVYYLSSLNVVIPTVI